MLITNATLVNWTPSQVIPDRAVRIEGEHITAIGPSTALNEQYPTDERFDARGRLLMPGNICAHTHFYGAYARGLAIPGAAPHDFPEILRKLWWPLDKALTRDDVRLSALVCLVDAIKHGTTTLIDHHASPNAIEGSLDAIADAVEQTGLRAVLCYEVTDRDGPQKAEAGIAENVRFIRSATSRKHIAATFGLHASLTLSDETLRKCVRAHPGGFHIHVAEHEADAEDSLTRSGMRTVQRLHRAGILGANTIAAHAVHVDPWEMEILRDTGTWVTHQPRSNMNNGVGAAAIDSMRRGGIRLCLGNDGFSNDMFAEWKAAYLAQKLARRDPRSAPGDAIAQMGADNNARLVESFFSDQTFGKIVEGAAADLIMVDYQPFTPLTGDNLPWHVIFGFESSMITATIVAGRVLMWDRDLKTLDTAAVAREALAHAPGVWERYRAVAERQ
ncbi:MAG TPA: putative aminohydrolase SsnA [Aggregatilineales bacterium]|nr:putative aminohydrolase SsnA [Aggregatilineales bacterium]